MAGTNKKLSTKRQQRIKINLWCWAFLAMTLAFYVVFMGYPLFCSGYYSLLSWSGMTSAKFIGLDNFRGLLTDKSFLNAFKNSVQYTLMIVPIELFISLVFAYILNSDTLRGRTAYRTVFFLPVITTSAIVGIIMVFIFSIQGPVNQLLTGSKLVREGINFLGSSKYAMPTVVAVSVWKDCGTYMIYWLAGLQSVPKDLYEAARVDGAGKFRTFVSVVFPQILPTAGIIAILCTINSLKVFDIVKTLTNGGPFYATDVMGTYIYRIAFSSTTGMPRIGYACAAALVYGILITAVGLILSKLKSLLQKSKA